MPSALGYTGELTDPNGLVYLRARAYAPTLGAFLTRDLVEGVMERVASRNGYGYVEGNPVNYTDPSGETAMTTGKSNSCLESKTCEEQCAAQSMPFYIGEAPLGGVFAYNDCMRTCRSIGAGCYELTIFSSQQITPSRLVEISEQSGADPVVLMSILEQETVNSTLERSLSPDIVRFVSRSGYPSFGVAQMQVRTAKETIARNQGAFSDALSLSETALGNKIHTSPDLAVRLAAHHIANLRADIRNDLYREGRISISSQDNDNLTILSYNQGWNYNKDDFFTRFIRRRDTDESYKASWFGGLKENIALNSQPGGYISNVKQYMPAAKRCLASLKD